MLVHRVTRPLLPLRGSVSCGSGWSVPCVSIQLTLSQQAPFHAAPRTNPSGSTVPTTPTGPPVSFYWLRSLLLRVMQAWERCAGTHTPQASSPIHPGIQYGNPGTVFTSIIPSIIIVGYVTSNISRNVTSSSLRVARALRLGGEGLVAPPLHLSVTRSDQIIFSAPRPPCSIPYSSASSASVAAPCTDAWVSRLLPTLGRPGGPFSFVN